jgi:hypothetical protein
LADPAPRRARRIESPFHLLCLIEIAAPLQRAWSGALAALAAVAISAAATQFPCPLDDPAHQLFGHLLPVVVLSMLGAIVGSDS